MFKGLIFKLPSSVIKLLGCNAKKKKKKNNFVAGWVNGL